MISGFHPKLTILAKVYTCHKCWCSYFTGYSQHNIFFISGVAGNVCRGTSSDQVPFTPSATGPVSVVHYGHRYRFPIRIKSLDPAVRFSEMDRF